MTVGRQAKRRLDVVIAEDQDTSRERARALIMAGQVTVNGTAATKCGALVPRDAELRVAADSPYVSRGGQKLEFALNAFGWTPSGLRCLDVGASTGGFTDCLLRRGARSVTALDVGYGQLAWPLRQDPRVAVIERCNFRHARPHAIGAPFDFICADVSFIALAKLAPNLSDCMALSSRIVALIKPQFEAGRKWVSRGGVVRDQQGRTEAIQAVIHAFHARELIVRHLTYSPVKGPAGNVEFLLGAEKLGPDDDAAAAASIDVAGAVLRAHEALE